MTVRLPAGQLSLFAPKRQRGTRPPAASEFTVHCLVADTLRRWITPGWHFHHPANGELRETVTAARLKRMGVQPGVSDFILFGPPYASVHALELKRKGSRPTPAQAAFLASVKAAGGKSAWTDSYEGAVAILKRWGAVQSRLTVQANGDVLVKRVAPDIEAEPEGEEE